MFSEDLIKHIQEVKRTSVAIEMERLDIIKANLKFVYDACVASEQLLIEAAQEILGWSKHSFTDRLLAYYRSHLEEERGEISLLKEDLESSGVHLGSPDYIAMAMIGTQYYLIKHQHPVCLLGYMAVTEGDPTSLAVVERLEELHGKTLFRSLGMHAIKDMEHRKELAEVIDQAPKTLRSFILFSADNALGYLEKAVQQWQTTTQA